MLRFYTATMPEPAMEVKEEDYVIAQREVYALQLQFKSIDTLSIDNALQKITKAVIATYDYLALGKKLNFADQMQPLINLDIAIQAAKCTIEFTQHIHHDAAVRVLSSEASIKLALLFIVQEARKDVYTIFMRYYTAIYSNFEKNTLSLEENLLVESTKLKYKRKGLELVSTEDQVRVMQTEKKLLELQFKYKNNLNNDNAVMEFTKSQLKGLPKDWFSDDKIIRQEVYRVTLKHSEVILVLDSVHDRSVRKLISEMYNTVKNDQNYPVMIEILKLRQQLATSLGYATYVDYAAEKNMLNSAGKINDFLVEKKTEFNSLQQENLKNLEPLARQMMRSASFQLEHYDMRYIINAFTNDLFNAAGVVDDEIEHLFSNPNVEVGVEVDVVQLNKDLLKLTSEVYDAGEVEDDENYYDLQEDLKSNYEDEMDAYDVSDFGIEDLSGNARNQSNQFFQELHVVNDVMNVYQELLGLLFVSDDVADRWNENVYCYNVFDANDFKFLGRFYLDLIKRPGKSPYAGVFNLIHGSKISCFTQLSGNRRGHECAMLCSFSENNYLSFDDVAVFLREFSKVMHQICSKTQHVCNGALYVKMDFADFSSHVLKKLCYNKEVLGNISKHKVTGAPIAAEVIERLLKAESFYNGYVMSHQLCLAIFDHTLHTMQADNIECLNLNLLLQEIRAQISKLTYLGTDPSVNFEDIFAGPRAGVQYSSLHSYSISKCIFDSVLQQEPLNKETVALFKKLILEPGATVDPRELIKQFFAHYSMIDGHEVLLKTQLSRCKQYYAG